MRIQNSAISEARNRKGWTQEHLSETSCISVRTIQRAETTGSVSAETAQTLCAVLGISMEEIAESPSRPENRKTTIDLGIIASIGLGFVGGLVLGLLL